MRPFVPIVRSLVGYPIDSGEWDDAARCAGSAEIEFAIEVALERLAERHE